MFERLMILFIVASVFSGCCTMPEDPGYVPAVTQQAFVDRDLTGVTFFVWGWMPDSVAGWNTGSHGAIHNIISMFGGTVADELDDAIDIAVIGESDIYPTFPGERPLSRRTLLAFMNRHNTEKYKLIAELIERDIEIISVELLLARLQIGSYESED